MNTPTPADTPSARSGASTDHRLSAFPTCVSQRPPSLSFFLAGWIGACMCTASIASTDINLTQDPGIRAVATYTYFARGNADNTANPAPFTTRFYPGPSMHGGGSSDKDDGLTDTAVGTALAVPFGSGDLTDNNNTTKVSGWVDIEDAHGAQTAPTHAGTFNILFDLKDTYLISAVEIVYTDSTGHRWVTDSGSSYKDQLVSTATSLAAVPPRDQDFTPLASRVFTGNATSVTAVFSDGSSRLARYINLQLTVAVAPGTGGSLGGYIEEVHIIGSPRPREVAMSSDDFVETMGVNTHFKGSEAIWNNHLSTIYTLLGESGIRHIRDGVPSESVNFERLSTLRNLYGIRTNWLPWGWGRTAPEPTAVVDAINNNPAIESLEGPNEPENTVIKGFPAYSYTGANADTPFQPAPAFNIGSYPSTKAWQDAVYSAIQAANPNFPVIAPAMAGASHIQRLLPLTSMTHAVMHSYPEGEMPSAGRMFQFDSTQMPALLSMAVTASSTKPVVVTESGYHTATGGSFETDRCPVSEAAQAKYTPRMFAEYALRGISLTYAYQFLDDIEDSANIEPEDNWGWVRYNLTPKPVYTAMKNLITLLGEATWTSPQWTVPAFTASPLDYTISCPKPSVHHLLLQKSTGEWYLLLWNEVSSYQTNISPWKDIPNDDVPVTLAFNTPIAKAETYKLASLNPTSTTTNPTTLAVNVPDEILVVKLTPSTLPSPWAQTEVGTAIEGSATSADGVEFTSVKGTGNYTSGDGLTDNRHFVYQLAQGDFTLKAHVDNQALPYATAGLMMRETLAANSRQVTLCLSSDGHVKLQSRTANSGTTWTSADQNLASHLQWLKLVRSNNTVTAFYSATDGNWTQLGNPVTISSLSSGTASGLFVCSGSASTLAEATFTGVSMDNTSVPVVTLCATDAFASQTGSDTGTVTVSRSGATTAQLTVNYTIAGSAVAGTHYTALTGSVTVPAGATFANITITPTTATNIQGESDVVLTLDGSSNYMRGAKLSDSVSIDLGSRTIPTAVGAYPARDVWYPNNQQLSTVTQEGDGFKWTYMDDGVTRHGNEINIWFSATQDWDKSTKLRIEFMEDAANPDTDFFQEIFYNYRTNYSWGNNPPSGNVSTGAGVGSIRLNKAPGYRTVDLNLGQFSRNQVNRVTLSVDGIFFATGNHVWHIKNIRLVGDNDPLPASPQ